MAIAVDTNIAILNGWGRAGDVTKGDWLYNPHSGLPTQVTNVQKYTPSEMYLVTTHDNVTLEVDRHTKFLVQTLKCRQRAREWMGIRKKGLRPQRYATVEQMLERGLRDYRGEAQYAVKLTAPIQWRTEDHPVPPFIVGMWMTWRNGSDRYRLDPLVARDVKKRIKSSGWSFVQHKNEQITVRPSIKTSFLTKYAKIPVKLPFNYHFGSVEQRTDLIRGLMALRVGSYYPEDDRFIIKGRDVKFLTNIQGILESLGVKTELFSKDSNVIKELTFRTDIQLLPNQVVKGKFNNPRHRIIKHIQKIQPVECIHIETEEPFVAGNEFLPIWH